MLDYVSALENLVSSNDSPSDLKRKTAQRTAVLLGANDAERLEINECVASAYRVRNDIAHGNEPKRAHMVEASQRIRPILRRALTAAVVLNNAKLGSLCDHALLSHRILREEIRNPIDDFYAAILPG